MSDRPHADSAPLQSKLVLPAEIAVAVWAAILAVALGGLYFFYSHGLTQLYGDTFAHMEAARRIFDSLTPGVQELGSVWLPMFHLLAAPLAINDHLWRTGLAGSLISVTAFCLSAWFLFRLALEMNGSVGAGLAALAAFLLCPSMVYLACTPMTEPLAILWAVLAAYGLYRYQMSGRTLCLLGAAVAAFCWTLTRYSAWYILPFAALFVLLAGKDSWRVRFRHAVTFSLIAGMGPTLWILHNALSYGNPIGFYNGPGSAKAIYAHQLATTGFRYPTDSSLTVSARYYIEDLKLIIGPWLLVIAVLGLIMWAVERRFRKRRAVTLLLLVQLPFYIQAMAGAAVGLYVPTYAPYSYYNLRYGIELLPALALLVSFVVSPALSRNFRRGMLAACVVVLCAQNLLMLAGGARSLPVVREGLLNTPCKTKPDRALIAFFRKHYDGKRILMQSGEWPCVASTLDIHYSKILCGNNKKYWDQIPAGAQHFVEWVVAGKGDPVDVLMKAHPKAFKDFKLVYHRHFQEQESIWIYRRIGG